jgi:hypothetical protein
VTKKRFDLVKLSAKNDMKIRKTKMEHNWLLSNDLSVFLSKAEPMKMSPNDDELSNTRDEDL